jgi:hypothetical protein
MNKEFVPYAEALALKELGFDEDSFGYYDTEGLQIRYDVLNITNKNSLFTEHSITNNPKISAPTFSQAFRWFREKYDWQHSIEPTADQHRFEVGYNYWIWNSKTGEEYHTMPKNRPTGDWEYETPEEAELECLKKLIEIVKQKQ